MKLARVLATLASMALGVVSASVATAEDSGWYIGANLGQSRAKIDDARIVGGLYNEGIDTTAIKDDYRHLGYKLFGGYQFDKYFALEGGYFDLGKFGYTANTLPLAGLTGNTHLYGANIDAVGTLPIIGGLSAFGRFGYDYAYARDTFTGYGEVLVEDPRRSEHGGNYKYGFGLQYAFNRSWKLRAEGERYRVDDAIGNKGDIDLYSVGLVYRFGKDAPPPVARVAPAPVIAPPEPPPPLPPVVPPPTRKKVSFSGDALFDFGKETLRPAGKLELDHFAAQLRGTRFDVIRVTGYSDRLGSPDYNMKLSQRRADNVKSYLVDTAGLSSDKVVATGADGSDPVTKPDACPGRARTPALIACLQPDRRVDIEVTGTQLQSGTASSPRANN